MKRTFFTIMLCALALTSCKKNEHADPLTAEEPTTPFHAPIVAQEDLLKEAKSKPLTNLVLSENYFDFGSVKKGKTVEHKYEVANTGKNPLIISQVKPGCGCTAPEYSKEPILPGQKGEIILKFDSSNFDGLQNKQAEVYANVEKAPIVISFSANVQR